MLVSSFFDEFLAFPCFFIAESVLKLPFLAFYFSQKPLFHDQTIEMTLSKHCFLRKFSREFSEKEVLWQDHLGTFFCSFLFFEV